MITAKRAAAFVLVAVLFLGLLGTLAGCKKTPVPEPSDINTPSPTPTPDAGAMTVEDD